MTPHRGATCLLVAIAAAATMVLTASCSSRPAADEASTPADLGVRVRFTAMWWSEAQMDGLNPNNPPPKNTEVELTRWEYTDPVGVPHPDSVDAVVTVENKGKAQSGDLIATIAREWQIGPLDDKSAATWQESTVLLKTDRFRIPAGSTHTARVPIDLKTVMDQLAREKRWPHALRVSVSVDDANGRPLVTRTQVEFPIRRGD
jgi:hypothetical protein